MNKEDYKILKEIASLDQQITKNNELLAIEEARVDKVQLLRDKRQDELTEQSQLLKNTKTQMQETENKIAHEQQPLIRSKENLSSLVDPKEIDALTKQIETKEALVDELENQGLELLDHIESLEDSIKKAETFLTGSLETIAEIKQEIIENNKPIIEKTQIAIERTDQLFTELPEDVVSKVKKLINKKLKFGPFTIINKNSCNVCGFEVDKVKYNQIEVKYEFKTCSTCMRVFIPLSAQY